MKNNSIVQKEDIKNESEIVYSALDIITQLCNNIINAKICLNDLSKCFRNADTLQALCIAANSGSISFCPHFNQIKSAMELCFKMFDYVEKCNKMMAVVVKYCNKISKGTQVLLCM